MSDINLSETSTFDSLQVMTQGGAVSLTVGGILLIMSLLSWYILLSKAVRLAKLKQASQMFIHEFWQAPTLQQAVQHAPEDLPVAALAKHAVESNKQYLQYQHAQQHAHASEQGMPAGLNQDEWVIRAIRRQMAITQASLEQGLTVLASVGSIAPFVGLFGTVWGIYHALVAIGASGQASIDKVAGPVGEALIMTAFGLAVAIPAVLAYNALLRQHRVYLGSMEHFAHELHTYLLMGVTAAKLQPVPVVNARQEVPA